MENLAQRAKHMTSKWWIFFILGAVLLLTGIAVITNPAAGYLALTTFFIISFLATGILRMIFSFGARGVLPNWGWQFALGALNVILGLFLVSNPEIAAGSLAFLVGFYLLFSSANIFAEALELRADKAEGSGWTMAMGVIGMIAAVFLLFHPVIGMGTLVIWTALAFMVNGIFYIWTSLKMHKGFKAMERLETTS